MLATRANALTVTGEIQSRAAVAAETEKLADLPEIISGSVFHFSGWMVAARPDFEP
jgi:hypothetical protein